VSVKSHRELKVWHAGMSLAKQVYSLTRQFPKEETYGISTQLRRAVVSIPSNIAEGYARQSTKELLQFLAIASGSLAEIETQILLAAEFGYVREEESTHLLSNINQLERMLNAFRSQLKKKLTA
jgi:four helix bundle protein